jgi:D-amino-acid dehydrogenase
MHFIRASEPQTVDRIASALHGLLSHSLQSHREILQAAGALGLLQETGQLHLYRDEAHLAKDLPSWTLRQRYGLRVESLARTEFLQLEPEVGPHYTLAMFTPEQGMSLNPHRHVALIADDFTRRGGQFVRDTIASIEVSQNRVTGVRSDGGFHSADCVVVSAGAWSARLLKPLGYRVPLETQRGYSLTFQQVGINLSRPVVAADRKVFFTPLEIGLRVAGTVEFGGLDRSPSRKRAELLLNDFARVFPQAGVPAGWQMWMGHRPCLPDSLPIIGRSSRHQNLWFNFGHGHLGLTMSARSGAVLAAAMAGDPQLDLTPFSDARFCRPGERPGLT